MLLAIGGPRSRETREGMSLLRRKREAGGGRVEAVLISYASPL